MSCTRLVGEIISTRSWTWFRLTPSPVNIVMVCYTDSFSAVQRSLRRSSMSNHGKEKWTQRWRSSWHLCVMQFAFRIGEHDAIPLWPSLTSWEWPGSCSMNWRKRKRNLKSIFAGKIFTLNTQRAKLRSCMSTPSVWIISSMGFRWPGWRSLSSTKSSYSSTATSWQPTSSVMIWRKEGTTICHPKFTL